MNVPRASLGNLREFVNASFPEPHNPIMALVPNYDPKPGSVGDFVWATFPEPHNPISGPGFGGMGGCGCGGSCGGCSGMGAVTIPTWALSLPAPLNGMLGPLPAVYWIGGGVAALLILPLVMGGKRGRR